MLVRFFYALLLVGFLNAFDKRISLPILETQNHDIYTNSTDLRIGESGFVIRQFDQQHSMIISRAVVVAIENDRAKLSLLPYQLFENQSMPLPMLVPQKDDYVIFRAFFNRAFLIAPNQQLYLDVTERYSNVEWLHPDLFAAFLMSQGKSAPSLADFKEICSLYATGVVYLIRSNQGELRDCQSFALLKQDTLNTNNSEQMKPFFSRLGNIERSWIGFLLGDAKIGDYYLYYNDVIRGAAESNGLNLFNAIINPIIGVSN